MIFNLGPTWAKKLPALTYTGQYEIEQDAGRDWKVRFLSSGTLTLRGLHQAVDLFCVGGGGGGFSGGGGGGYTTTVKGQRLKNVVEYTVTVGAGGVANGGNGGTSSVILDGTALCSAKGGNGGRFITDAGSGGRSGGNGGSGGGAQLGDYRTESSPDGKGNGGIDGGNGREGSSYVDYDPNVGDIWWTTTGGIGQGSTTREFGEADGALYSQGGYGYHRDNRRANSGNGGSNTRSGTAFGAGSAGVVVMRAAK